MAVTWRVPPWVPAGGILLLACGHLCLGVHPHLLGALGVPGWCQRQGGCQGHQPRRADLSVRALDRWCGCVSVALLGVSTVSMGLMKATCAQGWYFPGLGCHCEG